MTNIKVVSNSMQEETRGIYNYSVPSVIMENVSVTASGDPYVYGILNAGGSVSMRQVAVKSSGPTAYGIGTGSVDMFDCSISVDGIDVWGIQISGNAIIKDVDALAHAASNGIGIETSGATVEMYHVFATGIGDDDRGSGVSSYSSTLTILDSVIDGQSTDGIGVGFDVLDTTTATLTDVTLRGSGTSNYGILAYATSGATTFTLHHVIFENPLDVSFKGIGTSAFLLNADGSVFNGQI